MTYRRGHGVTESGALIPGVMLVMLDEGDGFRFSRWVLDGLEVALWPTPADCRRRFETMPDALEHFRLWYDDVFWQLQR